MANERQLGNIVYEVELEVAKLLEAQREVNSRLDNMQDGLISLILTSNTTSPRRGFFMSGES